jgi:hypothetical protein
MTPEQQAALEGVVGRALTPQEAEQIEPLLDPDNRNDVQIAAILSAKRWRYGPVRMVEIQIIGAFPLGPLAADAALAKLEQHAASQAATARLVGRAVAAIKTEPGPDFGSTPMHTLLDLLRGANVLTQQEADAFMALGRMDAPVHLHEVSRALNTAEGRMQL